MKNKKYVFAISIIIIAIFRLFLMLNTTIWHWPNTMYDDTLYLVGANNILNGKWLGLYSLQTLIKVESIYIYYVLLNVLKIPFMGGSFLLYFIAALLFQYAIKPWSGYVGRFFTYLA